MQYAYCILYSVFSPSRQNFHRRAELCFDWFIVWSVDQKACIFVSMFLLFESVHYPWTPFCEFQFVTNQRIYLENVSHLIVRSFALVVRPSIYARSGVFRNHRNPFFAELEHPPHPHKAALVQISQLFAH